MPTRVLLSIKPQFATAIMNGSKRYEFRRAIFRERSVSTVVIYASAPTQEVIGEFSVGEILSGHPVAVWKLTRHAAGISREYFDSYFHGREQAYAIEVKNPKMYRKPRKLLADFDVTTAPQSFCYI
jgi:predicted transcriptional regulator